MALVAFTEEECFGARHVRDQDPFWEAFYHEVGGIVDSNLELQDAYRMTAIDLAAEEDAPTNISAESRDRVLNATQAIEQHHLERAQTALQYFHELQQVRATTLYQRFLAREPGSKYAYKVLWNLEGTFWYDGHKPGDAVWKLYPMDGRTERRFPQAPFKWNSELVYCGEVPRPAYQNFARLQHVMPDMFGLLVAIVEWGVIRKGATGQALSPMGIWILEKCHRGTFRWSDIDWLKPLWDSCFADGFGFAGTQRKLRTDPMIAEVAFLLKICAESPNVNLRGSMEILVSMLEDCTGRQSQQLVERYEAQRSARHRVAILGDGNNEATRPNPLLFHEDSPHDIHEYYGQPKFLNDPLRICHDASGLDLQSYLHDSLIECTYIRDCVAKQTERLLPLEPLRLRYTASRDKFAEYCPHKIGTAVLRIFDSAYEVPIDRPPLPFEGFGSFRNPWFQDYILQNVEQPLVNNRPNGPFFVQQVTFVDPAAEEAPVYHPEAPVYHPEAPVFIQEAPLKQQTIPGLRTTVDPLLFETPPEELQAEFALRRFIRHTHVVPGEHVPANADFNTASDETTEDPGQYWSYLDN